MDSLARTVASTPGPPAQLPAWALPRGRDLTEVDAAFSAGAALKSLDDLVRSVPVWAGCWRARQALKCAATAVRLMGRNEDEHALRDALLLTVTGDDPGPAGKVFLAYKRLASRKAGLSSKAVADLADLLGLSWDDRLAAAVDRADGAFQSGRPAPFAAADLVTAIVAARLEAEPLAWALADMARCVRRCENGQLKEQSANCHFGLSADASDRGSMNAKETSDFSRRAAVIRERDEHPIFPFVIETAR